MNIGNKVRANLTFYFSEPCVYEIIKVNDKLKAKDICHGGVYEIEDLKDVEILE